MPKDPRRQCLTPKCLIPSGHPAGWARRGAQVLLLAGVLAAGCAPRQAHWAMQPPPPPSPQPSAAEAMRAEYAALALQAWVQGVYAREDGDLNAALERFLEAVQLDPENPRLRLEVARLQVQMGRAAEARTFLEAAIERFGGSASEHLLLARLELLRGAATAAYPHLLHATRLDSTMAEAWRLRGRVAYDQGRYEEALAAFRRLDALEPANPATLGRLGSCLDALGRTAEAVPVWERALGIDPEAHEVRESLARAYAASGRLEAAVDLLRPRYEEDPRLLDALVEILVEARRYEEAAAVLEPLYARQALDPRRQYVYARVLVELERYSAADSILQPLARLEGARGIEPLLGEIALRQRRWGDAERHWSRAIAEAPEDCTRHLGLALVLRARLALARDAGDSTRAIVLEDSLRAVLGGAAAVTPTESYRCHRVLGVTYAQLGDFAAALPHLEACRSLDPSNVQVLFDLAMAHQEAGHFETALQLGRQVLDQEPENAQALNFVGYLLAERGLELDASEKMIRRALEQDPDNPYYVDSLGWVFYQRGEYRDAARELQRAVELSKERDAVILEHLGDAFRRLGAWEDAYHRYQQSRAIDPSNAALLEKLEEVETRRGRP